MKTMMKSAFTMALLGGVFALGCSSSSNSDDGGGLGGAGGGSESDAGGDTGPTLYGLSTGTSCFDVVSIATGFNDGCMIGVGDPASAMGPVGAALPVTYTMSSATLTVGTQGSLGTGTIAFNMGTLNRAGNTSDAQMPTCTWHQTDTSNVNLTATNEFDIAVTEVENTFAAACGTTAPTGGTCTSTWTWHMKKSTTKTPAVDASGNPCQ